MDEPTLQGGWAPEATPPGEPCSGRDWEFSQALRADSIWRKTNKPGRFKSTISYSLAFMILQNVSIQVSAAKTCCFFVTQKITNSYLYKELKLHIPWGLGQHWGRWCWGQCQAAGGWSVTTEYSDLEMSDVENKNNIYYFLQNKTFYSHQNLMTFNYLSDLYQKCSHYLSIITVLYV